MDPTKPAEIEETYMFSLSYTSDKKDVILSMSDSTGAEEYGSIISYQSKLTKTLKRFVIFDLWSDNRRCGKKLTTSHSQIHCNDPDAWPIV